MFNKLHFLAALSVVLTIAAGAGGQSAPSDVPQNHWAYQAVEDLAKKGLIKGYPPDGKFVGGRTLTRYEMASIVKRVVDRMDDILSQPRAGGASTQEFDRLKSSVPEIQQLISEFKTQLTVIGTDMVRVKDDLSALKQQVGDLSLKVDLFDSRLSALSAKVDQTTVLSDQAIHEIAQIRDTVTTGLQKKVDVGVGKLTIGGLLQVWYGSAFGGTFGGNFPTNFSTPPAGRNFGGGVGDTFRLRRGQIQFTGSIAPRADYFVMLDLAKTASTATNPGNNILQDIKVGYAFAPRFRLEVGQQKTGLSEDGQRTNDKLLTVERAIMSALPPANGLNGNARDTGAIVRYSGRIGNVSAGIFNDNSNDQNTVSTDRFKFFSANANFTGIRHLLLGVWGGTKIGEARPRNIRDRAGLAVKLENGRHIAEVEYAYAQDRTGAGPAPRALGGYALYGYSLSRRWQLVGRYDEWDPSIHGGPLGIGGPVLAVRNHNLREYTFGINYYMRSTNAKIQLNYIVDDAQTGGVGFWGARRQLLLSNFQAAF